MSENSHGVPRVKICGVTGFANASAVAQAGADALGFNLWPGSRRFLDLASSREWILRMPPFVTRVAILVNPSLDEARGAWESGCFDLLQLHGSESAAFCQALKAEGIRFLKALAPEDLAGGVSPADFGAEGVLMDSAGPQGFGGTGETFDWTLLRDWSSRFPHTPLILSGGLRPENVAEAVRMVRPWAVDTASGVEDSPGMKSVKKVLEFCRQAREAALVVVPGNR